MLDVPGAGYVAATMARRAATAPGATAADLASAGTTMDVGELATTLGGWDTMGACEGSPGATWLLQWLTQPPESGASPRGACADERAAAVSLSSLLTLAAAKCTLADNWPRLVAAVPGGTVTAGENVSTSWST